MSYLLPSSVNTHDWKSLLRPKKSKARELLSYPLSSARGWKGNYLRREASQLLGLRVADQKILRNFNTLGIFGLGSIFRKKD